MKINGKSLAILVSVIVLTFYQQKALAQDIYDIDLEDAMELALDRSTVLGLPHPHTVGETMLQYSVMDMAMKGLQDGTSFVSADDVLSTNQSGMTMAPTAMMMRMHMFMFMYSTSDHITLNIMANYISNNMDMIMRMGTMADSDVQSSSSGIADMEASVFYSILNRDEHVLLGNIGTMIPFGSVNVVAKSPMGMMQKLPYPMQLGSGTVDPKLSLTYLNTTMKYSFGFDMGTVLRLYNNKFNYHFGSKYTFIAGGAYNWTKWLATTVRFNALYQEKISGEDSDYTQAMKTMSPTRDSENMGGTRVDGAFGLTLKVPKGMFQDLSLIIDYRMPIYQNLNGPQMTTTSITTVALKYIFGHKTLKN